MKDANNMNLHFESFIDCYNSMKSVSPTSELEAVELVKAIKLLQKQEPTMRALIAREMKEVELHVTTKTERRRTI